MDKTLLVVDDAMIIREMIKDIAVTDEWTIVAEAVNGQQAVARYRELRPTAVTLDLVMPESDGLQALREICGEDPSARVLVVSAIDQREVLQQALDLGASDFIVKPFAQDRLRSALDKLARRPRPLPL